MPPTIHQSADVEPMTGSADPVRPFSYPEFGPGAPAGDPQPIERIHSLRLHIAAVARARAVSLHQVASWRPGDIVELVGRPDDPVALELNGTDVGTGHMVVDDDVMSVRIASVRTVEEGTTS